MRARGMLTRLWQAMEGSSAVEYALLIGLIAAVLVIGITTLGINLSSRYDSMATALGS